ncbi:hypothetical protein [Glycomyces sp. NPDC047010]|uniref:hypothetical protein n=1 Tax=Glycomyces sp. NPDC047010 TaxID=3155023 RepID=UPI0033C86E4E
MLSNDAIVQGLNTLVAPTLGHTASYNGGGLPRLFACWEAPAAFAVCKFLPAATHAMFQAVFGRGVFGFDELVASGVPDAWLPKALAGPVSEWSDGSADPLVGVGLVGTPGTALNCETRSAWMALAEGAALRWEHTHHPATNRPSGFIECTAQDACGRVEANTPLWWEAEGILAPLERFRAAISGWPPVLPDNRPRPAVACPPSTGWAGPR